MAKQQIERPDNVIIPRWLQVKMDARNRQQMTSSELRKSLKDAGVEVPKNAKVDDMRRMLHEQSTAASALGRVTNPDKKEE